MAIIYRRPKIGFKLRRGDITYKLKSQSITLGRNEAVQWNAAVDDYNRDTDYRFPICTGQITNPLFIPFGTTGYDPKIPQFIWQDNGPDDKIRMDLMVDGNTWTSPPLVAPKRSRKKGKNNELSFSGMDATMFRASVNDVNMVSMHDQWSDYVLGQIANALNITLINPPHYKIQELDIQGQKGIDYISEIALNGGYNFHIDSNGALVFLPISYAGSTIPRLRCVQIDEELDLMGRITQFRLIKTSKYKNQYCYEFSESGFKTVTFEEPLYGTHYQEFSTFGHIDDVAYWQGGVSGKLVAYFSSEAGGLIQPTAKGMVDCATFMCLPPVNDPIGHYGNWKICFLGTPAADYSLTDYDVNFNYLYDSGWLPVRPDNSPVEASIMPTLLHAQAMAPYILQEINKDTWTLQLECPFNPWVPLGATFAYESLTARVEKVTHSAPPAKTIVDCMIIEPFATGGLS